MGEPPKVDAYEQERTFAAIGRFFVGVAWMQLSIRTSIDQLTQPLSGTAYVYSRILSEMTLGSLTDVFFNSKDLWLDAPACPEEQVSDIREAMKVVERRIRDLISVRNRFAHDIWFVGFGNGADQMDATRFTERVGSNSKLSTTRHTPEEINGYAYEAWVLSNLMSRLQMAIGGHIALSQSIEWDGSDIHPKTGTLPPWPHAEQARGRAG